MAELSPTSHIVKPHSPPSRLFHQASSSLHIRSPLMESWVQRLSSQQQSLPPQFVALKIETMTVTILSRERPSRTPPILPHPWCSRLWRRVMPRWCYTRLLVVWSSPPCKIVTRSLWLSFSPLSPYLFITRVFALPLLYMVDYPFCCSHPPCRSHHWCRCHVSPYCYCSPLPCIYPLFPRPCCQCCPNVYPCTHHCCLSVCPRPHNIFRPCHHPNICPRPTRSHPRGWLLCCVSSLSSQFHVE